jgi:hypothetical protein
MYVIFFHTEFHMSFSNKSFLIEQQVHVVLRCFFAKHIKQVTYVKIVQKVRNF